jgi:RNA-directed DNA polymerase
VKLTEQVAAGKEALRSASRDTMGNSGTNAQVYEELQMTEVSEQERTLETDKLMEAIVEKDNLNKAYRKVASNKGAAGIDGMSVREIGEWLKTNKEELVNKLLEGSYEPKPVRRADIPKPSGGKRQLGIPTVIDRVIQQALLQVLSPIIDPKFSQSSYGFRPNRSAHQALQKAQEYVAEGREIVVDIDLEKFFDKVNHDVLMSRIARHIKDKRVLKLVRRYLQAGVMDNGMCVRTKEGTPQGGPLSPLLANIMLDDLDKELEKRGHKFCRYADDCNIYVSSIAAGERVMESVTLFLEKQLRLKVNKAKSAVAPSSEPNFLRIPANQLWDAHNSAQKHNTNQKHHKNDN